MNTLIVIGIPLILELSIVGVVALLGQLRSRHALQVIANKFRTAR